MLPMADGGEQFQGVLAALQKMFSSFLSQQKHCEIGKNIWQALLI